MTARSTLLEAPTPAAKWPRAAQEAKEMPASPAGGEKQTAPAAMVRLYEVPQTKPTGMEALGFGLGMTAAIFLLLPISNMISEFAHSLRQNNSVSVVTPPPPPLPEIRPQEEEEVEEDKAPEFQEAEMQPISLSELQASLSVGVGKSFAGGADISEMLFQVVDLEDIIFEIKDLDRVPRLLSADRVEYPYEMKRNKIEGEVTLLVMIDPTGHVSVLEVAKSTHREFEMPAIRAARSAVYTPPTRNGEKVKVKFYLPFTFSLKDV